jgi:drug/metabolite transporter (DMT)-like permease
MRYRKRQRQQSKHYQGTSSIASLIAIAVGSVLLMSIVPVLIKWIQVNPTTIGIVRLAVAFTGMLLFSFAFRKKVIANKNDLKWLVLLGAVFAIHWYSYFVSIKLATASLAAIGVATFGIHLLILSSLIKGEKIVTTDWLAIALSIGGILIASPSTQINPAELNGFLLAILSGFLYACLPLINQRIGHLATHTRAIGQFGFALVGFLILLPSADFEISSNDWLGLLVLGILSTLIAHTLWIKVTTELPSNLTAVIYYTYIPISMLLSMLFLAEVLTWQKIVGASMIITANILVVILHKRFQKSNT